MQIKLVFPTSRDKDRILNYKADFIKNGETVPGGAGLEDAATFEAWFEAWKDNLSERTVRSGFVPATTYLAVDEEDNLIGMIDVRHRLNEYLMKFGGHIGYSVLKSQRQKGIATKMLSLALEECANLGIEKILITCDKKNIASAKVIRYNNGVLENEVEEGSKIIQRYWIANEWGNEEKDNKR